MRRMRTLSVGLVAAGILAVSCGPQTPADGPKVRGAQSDCDPNFSYEGTKTQGGVTLFDVGADASHESFEIRAVDQKVQQFAQMYRSTCKAYKAGDISQESYERQLESFNTWMMGLSDASRRFKEASDPQTRKEVLNDLWTDLKPTERGEYVVASFAYKAYLDDPASAPPCGQPGATGDFEVVAPGDPLPTKARTYFEVSLSRPAYLYVFQKKAGGEINALFPIPGINVPKPVPPNRVWQVPHPVNDGTFCVTPEDEGTTENVYLVVSVDPVPQLERAFGDPENLSKAEAIQELAKAEPANQRRHERCRRTRSLAFSPSQKQKSCGRTRGVVFSPAKASDARRKTGGGDDTATFVASEPGDGTIIKVFPFKHVPAAGYKKPDKATAKTRGFGTMMERPPG